MKLTKLKKCLTLLALSFVLACNSNELKSNNNNSESNISVTQSTPNHFETQIGTYHRLLENSTRIWQAKESKEISIPKEYKKFDFDNFTFFTSHHNKKITLKNGEYEEDIKYPDHYEGYDATSSVEYYDLTGDGKPEAILSIGEHTAAGSSYTSTKYLLLTENKGKLKKLWEFDTGSEAHCREFDSDFTQEKIYLQLIGDCQLDNEKIPTFKNLDKNATSDVAAYFVTKITFGWNGKKFVEEDREVVPIEDSIKEQEKLLK